MFYWHEALDDGWNLAFTDVSAGSLSHTVPGSNHGFRQREALREAVGISYGIQFMSQVHGRNVATIDVLQPQPEADGMISTSVPLAVMVADCLPILLWGGNGTGESWAAAIHAGRRGVEQEITTAAVQLLRERGASQLRAWIGPGICGSCYEVPEAMRQEVSELVPQTWSETSWGTPALDLAAGARAQLESLGVEVERIAGCTLEDDRLFSHRRAPGEGRFAGMVWKTEVE